MFDKTYKSFADRGVAPPSGFSNAWDPDSFMEILGDFEDTLNECFRLLENNRSYNSATGPVNNLCWSVFVLPNVHRLQQRILVHHAKIWHFLKPFEM